MSCPQFSQRGQCVHLTSAGLLQGARPGHGIAISPQDSVYDAVRLQQRHRNEMYQTA